jgi:hypothetical protein
MRRSKTVPLVPVDEGCDNCCDGVLTAQAAELAWWQRITYGTTAWRTSMGRRQVVESVNAALKGAFTDLGRGFFRVIGTTKMTVMIGFTLAGFNLDRIRSFRAKHSIDEDGQPVERPKQQRARRRAGTWADVVDAIETPPPQ